VCVCVCVCVSRLFSTNSHMAANLQNVIHVLVGLLCKEPVVSYCYGKLLYVACVC